MGKEIVENRALVGEIKTLIEQSKQQVSVAVNATISMLYWQVGNRINKEILKDQRAEYGKQIVVTLSQQLLEDYGNSFSEKNIRRMMQFATVFQEKEIVVSLIRQLSWTHLQAIIPIEDPLKRQF
jgi:hypothetical protein